MRKREEWKEILYIFRYKLLLLFASKAFDLTTSFRKKDYLQTKLYHAFYSFEALNTRSTDYQICGICGTIPDVLFGIQQGFAHTIWRAPLLLSKNDLRWTN